MSEEAIQRAEDEAPPPVFELFEDNADSFDAFMRVRTQWRMSVQPAGMSVITRPTGLDMVAVDVVLRGYGTPLTPALLSDLQAIEETILQEVTKK